MAKGGSYEREIAKQLGQWWDGRDDIFWRSSNSGGRATARYKATKKKTSGQHGDIALTDPIGKPFTDVLTLEIKRGYPRANIQDMLDLAGSSKKPVLTGFLQQAIAAHKKDGSHGWALLQRRDRRDAWLWLARHVWADLKAYGAFSWRPDPFVMVSVDLLGVDVEMVGMRWDTFLEQTTREHFEQLAREL